MWRHKPCPHAGGNTCSASGQCTTTQLALRELAELSARVAWSRLSVVIFRKGLGAAVGMLVVPEASNRRERKEGAAVWAPQAGFLQFVVNVGHESVDMRLNSDSD